MSGRRLLDAARIVGASRSIARQHARIRAQQWDVFTQTSSLAKAVKSQTDRVTVTAGAAFALARRFNETGPSYTAASGTARETQEAQHSETIPRQETVQGEAEAGQEEGIQQDHHYGRSENNAAVDPPPQGELEIAQEKPARYPLPDGTIPPQGSHLEASPSQQGKDTYAERPEPHARQEALGEKSHQSELGVTQEKPERYPLSDGSIPPSDAKIGTSSAPQGKDTFAERPQSKPINDSLSQDHAAAEQELKPTESGESTIPIPSGIKEHTPDAVRKMQRQSEFQIPSASARSTLSSATGVDSQSLGQDTTSSRGENLSPEMSSLPRMRIPKQRSDVQGGDEHIKAGELNQDVYYSSKAQTSGQTIPSQESIPQQDQISEDINTDIFYSPRVSSMINNKKDERRKAYEMKMRAAKGTPHEQTAQATGRDQETFNVRDSSDSISPISGNATSGGVAQKSETDDKDETLQFAQSLAADVSSSQPSTEEVRHGVMNSQSSLTLIR